jgi:hypothetical protein
VFIDGNIGIMRRWWAAVKSLGLNFKRTSKMFCQAHEDKDWDVSAILYSQRTIREEMVISRGYDDRIKWMKSGIAWHLSFCW